jgi:hypothetical protein
VLTTSSESYHAGSSPTLAEFRVCALSFGTCPLQGHNLYRRDCRREIYVRDNFELSGYSVELDGCCAGESVAQDAD